MTLVSGFGCGQSFQVLSEDSEFVRGAPSRHGGGRSENVQCTAQQTVGWMFQLLSEYVTTLRRCPRGLPRRVLSTLSKARGESSLRIRLGLSPEPERRSLSQIQQQGQQQACPPVKRRGDDCHRQEGKRRHRDNVENIEIAS